jgi:4-amino-4-deoxy-L-arabinose transferase-like glycosyltransferase
MPVIIRRGWVPVTLVLVLAIAWLLYTWNISYTGYSIYYASAARSMSRSWHAFAFGAFDPAATITLDKLSGFLVPQALAIRLLGFHAWVLALPQAIEGVVTVFCAYVFAARWRGRLFGLAVAGVVTSTPLLAAMFGKPMEDSLLTMAMALALVFWQRSLGKGSPFWLLGVALAVAIGFQAKMLQAWIILPALAIGYLVGAEGPVRSRLLRVLGAGALTVALSVAWMTAMQLVPAGSRPYFDGSTNNNVFSMVFGYNGIDRIFPQLVPGAVPQLDPIDPGTATALAAHSPIKLVLPQYTTQIGWLYPAAMAGAIFGVVRLVTRRSDRVDGAIVLSLLGYIALVGVVLSAAVVPHATYFAVLGVPLALLAIAGIADAVAAFIAHRKRSWVPLVALAAVQGAWSVFVFSTGALAFRWISLVVLATGLLAVALLVVAATRAGGRIVTVAVTVLAATALLGPIVWSACVIGAGGGGSASDAYAGPRPPGLNGLSAKDARNAGVIRVRKPYASRPDQHLAPSQAALLNVMLDRVGPRPTLFATDDKEVAASFTMFSPYEVLLMGGFSGHASTPSLAQLRSAFGTSAPALVLLADASPAPTADALAHTRALVRRDCRPVMTGQFESESPATQTLYACSTDRI